MKKLFFAAVIMMASVVSAFAQHEAGDITLQGRVGMIGSDFNNTSDTKARVGLVIGPEMEYFLRVPSRTRQMSPTSWITSICPSPPTST